MSEISISDQLTKIFEQYGRQASEAVEKAAKKTGRDTVKELKQTSPKRYGDYAKSWTTKTKKSNGRLVSVTVYNKEHYRLTHLLENGHVIKNGSGTYGRVNGRKHIQPAEQNGIKEFEEQARAELEAIT